jgi:hypothetical protein
MIELNTEYKFLSTNINVCFNAKFKTIFKCWILGIWHEAKN